MSSMRNAVQRRNHRERGQPEERKKWGLLEKSKDYKLRAADHKVKKTKLKQLKQKVLDKNPDEFYFGMLSRSGPATRGKNRTGTVNGDRGNQVLSQEASRLFKTQDIGYIRTMRNQITKEVAELEEKVQAMGGGTGKKVVFVDDEEELELRVQEGEWEVEAAEEKEQGLGFGEKDLRKLQRREREKLENRLGVARERLGALTEAEEALEMQRARMAKSTTVGGTNKNGVKFKVRERKR
ncbi:U3 small nucleolar RNA-associated protein 11 [Lachnellula cervina]|uniref:U3 small nucleolar RNA-associated protein 11 n=1 Tax=Lachnellula cervina TaxID=1316786 RepID=A0A7D8UPA3_9HELO|nr:U3 small nucleolar RNA-associated protein 11 [Lachnellula cervina]